MSKSHIFNSVFIALFCSCSLLNGIGQVTQVSAGLSHTMYVKTDGSMWGVGYNGDGQLGDGTTEDKYKPVQIVSGGVTQVSAGVGHTMYVKSDGSLWGMGWNGLANLGTGQRKTSPRQC
jgi:alpha-tubulin suppressor-like RCC1 family protein